MTATIAQKRASALHALNVAKESPAIADWQSIAETLAALIPASKAENADTGEDLPLEAGENFFDHDHDDRILNTLD